MKSFISAHTAKLDRLRRSDWSSCDESELLREIHYLINIHGLTQWYVVLAGINMMVRNKLLAKFVTCHTPTVTGQQLLKGLVGLKSLEPNQYLKSMAVKARRLAPRALAAMERGDPSDIRKTLAGTSEGDELLGDMERFMEKYGFLSSSGTDFSVTPWCEDPSFVWKSIVRLAGGVPESDPGVTRSERLDHIVAVSEQLSWFKRIRFRRMLARTTEYIDMREKISMLMSKDAYQMRRLALVIADKFTERGILKARDEIFFLYIDEIEALVAHQLDEAEARSRISLRISEMEADARIEPSDTICGDQITYKTVTDLQNQNYLVGICGSPGKVTGRARIVRNPRETLGDLGESDILVVPFTDAGWTPLFTVVAGVVAETGGILSHTSIVAREYELPAIVNVKNATVVIKDNQIITLDAQGGRVYLK
jgi:pyruvate,water dikinase